MRRRARLPVLSIAVVLAAVTAGALVLWILPIFKLPRPSGPHPIGQRTWHATPGEPTVTLWYPAASPKRADPAPYLPPAQSPPSRWLWNLRFVRTHAHRNAEPAAQPGGWPVILFVPAWGGGAWANSTLCEALASNGFVVAAVEPPIGPPLPGIDFSSAAGIDDFERAARAQLGRQTDALLGVVTALAELNAGDGADGRFREKLNLGAIGVGGYSFGGAVAAEAIRRDPRLRAGANLDGTLFSDPARFVPSAAPPPFIFITDRELMPTADRLNSADPLTKRLAEFSARGLDDMHAWLRARGGWLVEFDGAPHGNFAVFPLFARLGRFTGVNPRTGPGTLLRINACAVAFFQRTLRLDSVPWLEKNSHPWPGVTLQRFFPPKN